MKHDLNNYRADIVKYDSYVASDSFPSTFKWHRGNKGHILIHKESNQNAVVSVVGKILEDNFNCSAIGNFTNSNRSYDTLQSAKFQLMLEKPEKTPFETDFSTAIRKLTELQNLTAVTKERRNLILEDGAETHLRFSKNVFEERRVKLPGSSYDSSFRIIFSSLLH